MNKEFIIEYLPIAQQDLEEIFIYIKKDNIDAAANLIDEIDQKISQLTQFPYLGTIPKDDRLEKLGYRLLIIKQYLVFYVVKESVIEIRRILHGRRQYDFLL
ncbi:MAG: type II toxin-antitoxin system RelE/ParE family toxin [Promethearchaeota archaeon]|nr:MAG: type II toxin-antitoxin system RelE/ParE family toxin [Candidatus Lokiarchaeota archaeon]